MMQGKSNKAICRVLDLAEPTVKNHVTAIFKALKVVNRTEAAIAARELGWDLKPAIREKTLGQSFSWNIFDATAGRHFTACRVDGSNINPPWLIAGY